MPSTDVEPDYMVPSISSPVPSRRSPICAWTQPPGLVIKSPSDCESSFSPAQRRRETASSARLPGLESELPAD